MGVSSNSIQLLALAFFGTAALYLTGINDPRADWFWGIILGVLMAGAAPLVFRRNGQQNNPTRPALLILLSLAICLLLMQMGLPALLLPLAFYKVSPRRMSQKGILREISRSPDTLKISGPTIDSASPRLPQALIGDIVVEGTHTIDIVTAITNPLRDAITRCFVGQENDPVVPVSVGEIVDVLSFLNPGLAAPEHLNLATNPTDNTAQDFSILFRGPFDLRSVLDPVLFMEINPTLFGTGGVTSYSMTGRVHARPYQGGVPKRLFRAGKSASTDHTVSLGNRSVDAVFIRTGAGGVLQECHIADQSGRAVEDIWTVNQARKLAANYAAWKSAAPVASPTLYMSRGYKLAPYRGRVADITLSGSQTLQAWAVGPG